MDGIRSSETLVIYHKTKLCHNPETTIYISVVTYYVSTFLFSVKDHVAINSILGDMGLGVGRRKRKNACSKGTSHSEQNVSSLKFCWGCCTFSNITEGKRKDKTRKGVASSHHFVKRSLYFCLVPNWPINF
jgi:hypothetical protein